MVAIYENHFKQDEATLKEVFLYQYFRDVKYILIDVMMLGVIIFNLFFHKGGSFVGKTYPICLEIIFWAYKYFACTNLVRSVLARNQEAAHGGALENNILISKGGFVYNDNAGVNQRVEFTDLAKAYCTKSCIVLQTKDGTIYICRKDAFTLGDADSFIAHLKKKGVKVK